MNPSDWIKAAALVTQHKQKAATSETDQLSSMPLSQIAMDDSGPPVVHYGTHMPTATSTLTGTDVHAQFTAGSFLSANNTRYSPGFIIPYFIITQLRSSNLLRRGTITS